MVVPERFSPNRRYPESKISRIGDIRNRRYPVRLDRSNLMGLTRFLTWSFWQSASDSSECRPTRYQLDQRAGAWLCLHDSPGTGDIRYRISLESDKTGGHQNIIYFLGSSPADLGTTADLAPGRLLRAGPAAEGHMGQRLQVGCRTVAVPGPATATKSGGGKSGQQWLLARISPAHGGPEPWLPCCVSF